MCSVLRRLIKKSHIFSSHYNETRHKLIPVLVVMAVLAAVSAAIAVPGILLTNKSTGIVLSTKKEYADCFYA
jgi:hypothetical protein